jgi:two-component system sensor histidine kinase AlgZ
VPTNLAMEPADDLPDDFFIPDLCHDRAVLVCAGLAQLLVVVFALDAGTRQPFDWVSLGMSSAFVQWIVLFSAGSLCLLRPALQGSPIWLASLAAVGTPTAVTVASSATAMALLMPGYLTLDTLWLLRNTLVALIFSSVAFRYFYLQYALRQRERAALQARLDSLRNRMRPHFLFNTMNSIASLIAIEPLAAERAVEDLSELLRASLRDADDKRHTVAAELRLCALYLGIEQLRLGERLSVNWQVEEQAKPLRMPSLILQPLVENAIYHGVARIPAGGCIDIVVRLADERLEFELQNPLPLDADTAPHTGNRVALANIRARLQALYGAAAALDTRFSDQMFIVTLSLPVQTITTGLSP